MPRYAEFEILVSLASRASVSAVAGRPDSWVFRWECVAPFISYGTRRCERGSRPGTHNPFPRRHQSRSVNDTSRWSWFRKKNAHVWPGCSKLHDGLEQTHAWRQDWCLSCSPAS